MNDSGKNPSLGRWIGAAAPYAGFTLVALFGIGAWCWIALCAAFLWHDYSLADPRLSWLLYGFAVCSILNPPRMFFITGYTHRGLSHRSYKAGRKMLLWMGFAHSSTVQKGPLWWAAHHRHHHNNSDDEDDVHSPVTKGVLYSHLLWICDPKNKPTDLAAVQDLVDECPELLWLQKRWVLYIAPLAILCLSGFGGMPFGIPFWFGALMSVSATFFLHQAVYLINSLNHLCGTQRFPTGDQSRNNPVSAFLTLGEGWHNNHHWYMNWALSFQTWLESLLDLTWKGLLAHDRLGLIQIPKTQKDIAKGICRHGSYAAYQSFQVAEARLRIQLNKEREAEKEAS